jgi:hypothetical protein
MRSLLSVSLLGLFSLLSLAGVQAATKTANATATTRAHLSNAEIEHAIRAKLAKSKIGKDGFTDHVKGGVVTWAATTNLMQHKGAATRMARSAGAVEVVNKYQDQRRSAPESRRQSVWHRQRGPSKDELATRSRRHSAECE